MAGASLPGSACGRVLIVNETGDPKRRQRVVSAAQQYLGKWGHVANGVVAVTSHWSDGSRHVPVGVKPYRPASRLPKGRKDPAFHTKPALAWQLIAEARAAGIPFRLVVADSIYGENAELENKLFAAQIPSIMGLRPSPDSAHGTWQQVDDPRHLPAFTPAEAAERLPLEAWARTVRFDSHGKEVVRSMTELELGTSYGPAKSVRLVTATRDPRHLKPESTWYLATSLPLAEVSAEQVYEIYRLRDGIEHYDKPVKHELGWTDYQMRPERAIVRHWQLALLAYSVSLLVGALPARVVPVVVVPEPDSPAAAAETPAHVSAVRKIRTSNGHGRAHRVDCDLAAGTSVVATVGSAAALGRRWSTAAPPPELAALLAHVARSRPLEVPT